MSYAVTIDARIAAEHFKVDCFFAAINFCKQRHTCFGFASPSQECSIGGVIQKLCRAHGSGVESIYRILFKINHFFFVFVNDQL